MEKMPLDSKKNKKVNVRITFTKNKSKTKINSNKKNSFIKKIENDFPTEEEIYQNRFERQKNLSKIKIQKIQKGNGDELISVKFSKKNLNSSFSSKINKPKDVLLNNSNKNIFSSQNINISNLVKINKKNPNKKLEKLIDKKIPHPIKKNNINNNNINLVKKNKAQEIIKLTNNRIKIGNNEFEDLTKEARELQNKQAYEKKILGLTQEYYNSNIHEKKPFLEKIGDFFNEHQNGISTVLDGIGCIILYRPSIDRTLDRIDKWVGSTDDIEKLEENENHLDNNQNIILQKGIRKKNKDFDTIIKFLPIWEIKENKKSENNNKCTVCLYEFKLSEKITALPCLHIFHCDCIKCWLKNELTCPVCKFEVTLSSIIGKYSI